MPEKETKKFQPLIVASFDSRQLQGVYLWAKENVKQTEESFTQNFLRDIQTVELDEKGKKMDENSRERLGYGVKILGMVLTQEINLRQLRGRIQVWKMTSEGEEIEVRWNNSSVKISTRNTL